jgi:LPXTG-motif cell wall-anchored protein
MTGAEAGAEVGAEAGAEAAASSGGVLPATGAEDYMALLAGGGALLVAGTGLMVYRRRFAEGA